ncbi:ImmA/IrrE family metallo-endopeptidase [Dehalogenimonas sp. THU2]|uniref:ImmA/IrrE family metallo-endopeptidase n=1 Tax=Dehalogenimonas sp. THU2 TaxID=3151121 RepID=UPI0032186AF2
MRTLRAVASCCGINLNGTDKMPHNLRGYHEVFDSKKNIYFRQGDTLSGQQNTILHEIREMMETLFAEADPSYDALRTSARHLAANRFATAVLLPRDDFIKKVYETGLDVIELASFHSKSCAQVLLRMGEVLQGKLFVYSALYEPCGEGSSAWQVAYWTGCHNDEEPESNVSYSDGYFPRKGRHALPGSLINLVIKTKKPHLARVTLSDDDDNGLLALARPLMISGDPIKAVLTAVLSTDRSFIEPQIGRLRPIDIKGFFKHL